MPHPLLSIDCWTSAALLLIQITIFSAVPEISIIVS